MGPYGTRILGDLGADVVKIEPPEGDTFRNYGPLRHEQMNGSVLNLHRNKRSVRLDLKDEGAREALRKLIADADVLVHNLRPQAAARAGLDWDSVSRINPRMVLCAARGFSQAGPYGDKAAYDDLLQAGSGYSAFVEQTTGQAGYAPTAWCDKVGGQAIATAVMGALLHRERGGSGQEVEVPMFEVAIDFMLVEHFGPAAFEPALGPAGFKRQLARDRRPYRTQDGWACILPYSDRNWKDFFAFIGQPELGDDPRYQKLTDRVTHIDSLYRLVAEHAPGHTTQEWVAFCDRVSIPCMPVLRIEDLQHDPHVVATSFMAVAEHPSEGAYHLVQSPLRFGATPYSLQRHAPRVGEHTAEVLREAGVSESEVARLAH
ncbi:CoA transferase [Ramlibacter sp. G-1-2-2]|uniref:CoA transferase n=2 Tax=Ramlibacter agri TaxID=2728837 RepID=A0A848H4G2_9BURK|nr:CoA transferase [Ramlibacter agri]